MKANPNKSGETGAHNELVSVPESNEEIVVNNNDPYFSNENITSYKAYDQNGTLNLLGRVTTANAIVSAEIIAGGEIWGHKWASTDQER